MKTNKVDFKLDDVISVLKNPYINNLNPLQYGKAIQSAVEFYVTESINASAGSKILIDIEDEKSLVEQFNYSNNGPGFDRLLVTKQKRCQLKFRQVDGSTPFSKQTHFENTRRHSEKNQGSMSKTGLVCYSTDEFDYVIVTLCHIKNGERTNYTEWSYSLIPVTELEDSQNPGFCLPKIPSNLLSKHGCSSIQELVNKINQI